MVVIKATKHFLPVFATVQPVVVGAATVCSMWPFYWLWHCKRRHDYLNSAFASERKPEMKPKVKHEMNYCR